MNQHHLLGNFSKILGILLYLALPAYASVNSAAIAQTQSKTDTEQLTDTLVDYMEGVANGQPERLRKAFHPDFKLYATTPEKKLLVRSGEQYIKDVSVGGKLNRIGRVISTDIENDVATAKVEILVPGSRLFTDYFMLVKYEGSWKIINKSYTWKAAPKSAKKILVITSNQHTYGNTQIDAANHFQEIVVAYDIFKQHGYAVDFVSPQGGAIPIGYVSTSNPTQKQYLYDTEFMNLLKHTFKPEQIKPNDYQAVYYSGGGAAMFGVADNAEIQGIAGIVYKNGGVISAVCHGTAGIVNLKDEAGVSLFLNKKITGFPDSFEDKQDAYYKTFPFSIDAKVKENGGILMHSKTFGSNFFVVDGRFVTGQDPSSTASVANKVIEAIQTR